MKHVSQGLESVITEAIGHRLAESPQLVEGFRQVRKALIEARAYTPLLTHPDASSQNITMMAHLYGQIEFTDIVLTVAESILNPPSPLTQDEEDN